MTGSFQTIVTQGLPSSVISSGVRSARPRRGSRRTPVIVAHARAPIAWWCSDPRVTRALDRPAHRPLRADHAPGRAARGHRAPALGLRALPASPARGAALRRGGRRRAGPRRGRATSASTTRRSACCATARSSTRPTLDVAGRLPVLRRHLGLRRGRGLLPLLPAGDRRVDVRRGGAAGDAAALDLQPRLGDRLGRVADDAGRRRPALHRDGLAAHPRGGGGGLRAGGVRRRLRGHLQPRGAAALRRPDGRHVGALASRCCTTPRRTRSGRR